MSFAFPVAGGISLIIYSVVALIYLLRKGKLYIIGGARMVLGTFMLLTEFLMGITFGIIFIGWSIYPLSVLVLFGGFLIFLAINSTAREMMERKLFF